MALSSLPGVRGSCAKRAGSKLRLISPLAGTVAPVSALSTLLAAVFSVRVVRLGPPTAVCPSPTKAVSRLGLERAEMVLTLTLPNVPLSV